MGKWSGCVSRNAENSSKRSRRMQLVEIKARKNRLKLTRRTIIIGKLGRIITDHPQGLSSANYGLIFVN